MTENRRVIRQGIFGSFYSSLAVDARLGVKKWVEICGDVRCLGYEGCEVMGERDGGSGGDAARRGRCRYDWAM
ncbi:hypothetical protein KS4_07600 [Poriferisphaera corsica]|uniref:Uncharacterized protein n=1 Tax=Poriferisphaera corsica TaxID=2528020 RepID=A0A517YR77_9BACT|nr:hypothetical protein KS4_07600 [Poriferisphaera corsica]